MKKLLAAALAVATVASLSTVSFAATEWEVTDYDQTVAIFDDGTVVTDELLWEAGVVRHLKDGVKVLNNGELTKKLTLCVPATKSAVAQIESLGGKVEVK